MRNGPKYNNYRGSTESMKVTLLGTTALTRPEDQNAPLIIRCTDLKNIDKRKQLLPNYVIQYHLYVIPNTINITNFLFLCYFIFLKVRIVHTRTPISI
jgi:hypothetical protein